MASEARSTFSLRGFPRSTKQVSKGLLSQDLLTEVDHQLTIEEDGKFENTPIKHGFHVNDVSNEVNGMMETSWKPFDPLATVRGCPGVLEVMSFIGEGQFSFVFACMVEDSGEAPASQESALGCGGLQARRAMMRPVLVVQRKRIAVKLLHHVSPEQNREAKLMMMLSHPNLVCVHKVVEGPPHGFFLDLCSGGSLAKLIHTGDGMEWWKTLGVRPRGRLALDVLQAVEYIHAYKIVHRDIKTSNCLLTEPPHMEVPSGADADVAQLPHVKLGDLGVARPAAAKMTRGIGTIRSMAPEVICSCTYGLPADIYSCGVLLHELISGQKPFSVLKASDAALAVAIVRGHRPSLDLFPDNDVGTSMRILTEKAWRQEPEERLEAIDFVSCLKRCLAA